MESERHRKPDVYLLLGISLCIGICSIQDPVGLDLGHLNIKIGRIGDSGDCQ